MVVILVKQIKIFFFNFISLEYIMQWFLSASLGRLCCKDLQHLFFKQWWLMQCFGLLINCEWVVMYNFFLRFKCIDLDANGILTRNEMQFFYEEQLHRMECMAQEPVLFEDILCQIIDMIGPEVCPLLFCNLTGSSSLLKCIWSAHGSMVKENYILRCSEIFATYLSTVSNQF